MTNIETAIITVYNFTGVVLILGYVLQRAKMIPIVQKIKA
jgi:hypothetical protein